MRLVLIEKVEDAGENFRIDEAKPATEDQHG